MNYRAPNCPTHTALNLFTQATAKVNNKLLVDLLSRVVPMLDGTKMVCLTVHIATQH